MMTYYLFIHSFIYSPMLYMLIVFFQTWVQPQIAHQGIKFLLGMWDVFLSSRYKKNTFKLMLLHFYTKYQCTRTSCKVKTVVDFSLTLRICVMTLRVFLISGTRNYYYFIYREAGWDTGSSVINSSQCLLSVCCGYFALRL